MAKENTFIISGIVAFGLYFCIIGTVFIFLNDTTKVVDGLNSNDVLLEVVLENDKTQSIKEFSSLPPKEELFQNSGINDKKLSKSLFESPTNDFDTATKTKENISKQKKPELNFYIEQREKLPTIEQEFSKIKSIEKKSYLLTSNNPDPYYSKIYEMLSSSWQPMGFNDNLTAKVIITIYRNGKFDYVIVRKSGVYNFDNNLILFLEKQKLISYPVNDENKRVQIEVNFTSRGV